ncbi:Uncharacterized protein HZ326_18407, partial [Fusarium oxysporum f. sp. albedinis]
MINKTQSVVEEGSGLSSWTDKRAGHQTTPCLRSTLQTQPQQPKPAQINEHSV